MRAQLETLVPSWRHWWNETRGAKAFANAGLTTDQGKAALTFEGLRRRDEIATAAERGLVPADWQPPSRLAIAWRRACWRDLDDKQQAQFIAEIRSPLFLPPLGFSFFPDDDLTTSKEHALQPLSVPASENIDEWRMFIERCRILANAGFTVCAVDTKTMKGIRMAAMALEDLPRTFRQADVRITVARRQTQSKRGLSSVAAGSFSLAGHTCINGRWIASRHFHFWAIAQQIEAFDKRGVPSAFISAIRV